MNQDLDKVKIEKKELEVSKSQDDKSPQPKSLSHEEIEWVNREIRF